MSAGCGTPETDTPETLHARCHLVGLVTALATVHIWQLPHMHPRKQNYIRHWLAAPAAGQQSPADSRSWLRCEHCIQCCSPLVSFVLTRKLQGLSPAIRHMSKVFLLPFFLRKAGHLQQYLHDMPEECEAGIPN